MRVNEIIINHTTNQYAGSKLIESTSDAWDAYEFLVKNPNDTTPELENIISTDAEVSYLYAKDVLHGPFPAGESIIATNIELSLKYAKFVLHGRFPAAESLINSNPKYANYYKNNIVNGIHGKGVSAITSDPVAALDHALETNRPFPQGEAAIASTANTALSYALFLNAPFPKGEPAIIKDYSASMKYMKEILRNNQSDSWENLVKYDAETSFDYATIVLNARFRDGEPTIAERPDIAELYNERFGTEL